MFPVHHSSAEYYLQRFGRGYELFHMDYCYYTDTVECV